MQMPSGFCSRQILGPVRHVAMFQTQVCFASGLGIGTSSNPLQRPAPQMISKTWPFAGIAWLQSHVLRLRIPGRCIHSCHGSSAHFEYPEGHEQSHPILDACIPYIARCTDPRSIYLSSLFNWGAARKSKCKQLRMQQLLICPDSILRQFPAQAPACREARTRPTCCCSF